MAKLSKDAAYSPREISNFLRNAVVAATRPVSGPIEDPIRLRQIRAFSVEFIQYMEELVLDGDLKSYEELVLSLVAAAWAVQNKHLTQ